MSSGMQSTLASLVFEGVFERFPKLKVVLIEGGFAWAPALGWRMDKHWERMRAEMPHVKRPPSEYVREHVWFTTQPIEEPDDPEHLADIMQMGRLGPAHVLDRLPALGLRRSQAGVQVQADAPSSRPCSSATTRERCTVWHEPPGRGAGERGCARRVQDRHRAGPRDRAVQRRRRVLRALQPLPAQGRRAVPRHDRRRWSARAGPASITCRARASSSAAPGTAGSSTSAPASPGATPTPSRRGSSR